MKMYDAIVDYDVLLVRSAPGTGADIVGTIKKGANVHVKKEKNGYCQLDDQTWIDKAGICQEDEKNETSKVLSD